MKSLLIALCLIAQPALACYDGNQTPYCDGVPTTDHTPGEQPKPTPPPQPPARSDNSDE